MLNLSREISLGYSWKQGGLTAATSQKNLLVDGRKTHCCFSGRTMFLNLVRINIAGKERMELPHGLAVLKSENHSLVELMLPPRHIRL